MSDKKGFEADLNTDSGFLSGPIDQFPEQLRDEPEKAESDKRAVTSESDPVDLDSGLDLCASLSSLRMQTLVPQVRVTDDSKSTDIPPLAILFQQDDDGDTQLHIAAVHGCQRSVSTLIKVCPDKCWLDLPNDFGHTALHLAVMSGHAVVARMLVQSGASLEMRDVDGNTALHVATADKNVDCLKALLGPVDRMSKKLSAVLNLKNYDGQTCVHLAAKSGHLSTLQTLVFYGADINAREGMAGWTALHITARRGDTKLARYLMERCAGVAVRARDYASRTPRRLARRSAAAQTRDFQKLFKGASDDSDSETDDDDEYDSDDGESLFDRLKGSFTSAPVATN